MNDRGCFRSQSPYRVSPIAYGHNLTHDATKASYWASQAKFADTLETTQDSATLGCTRCSFIFSRTVPTGVREDFAVMGMSFAKIVGGGQYGVLVAADMIALETAFTTLRVALQPITSDAWRIKEWRWHEHRASHATTAKGNELVGPPVRVTLQDFAWGTASGRNTDQVASTVSFRTTSRKHWGRVYLPGIQVGEIDPAFGRLKTTTVDTIASAFRALEATANTNSVQLGVWSWKYRAFLQLSELRVDNVLDIQRRRRPKQSSYFKSYVS